MAAPELLWTPSAERVERANDHALPALAAERARADLRRLRSAVAVVGRRPRGVLGFDRRVLRRPLRGSRRAGARPARDAGRGVVPGRAAELRRAHLPRQDPTTDVALRFASELRDARLVDVGRAARADGGDRRRAASARRRRGRPRGRVHAEHPRDGRGVPRVRVARRGVVLGGARVRRPQRDRPVRADRAEGAARGRRLPLRRQGLRPARDQSPRSPARSRRSSGS